EGEAPGQLYRIDLPSLEMSRISTDDSRWEQQPRVREDEVSFMVVVPGPAPGTPNEGRLCTSDLTGDDRVQFASDLDVLRIALLGDGRQALELLEAAEGSKKGLYIQDGPQIGRVADLGEDEFLMSAAGRYVLTGLYEGWEGSGEFFLIDVETGEREQILDGLLAVSDAELSPDGSRLVYVSNEEQHNLFVVNIDGSGLTQLTHDSYANVSPSWSPDGKYIVYASCRNGSNPFRNHTLHVITADGSRQVTITEWVDEGMDDDNPCWTYSK
ncbi:MAG: PD40 domain-containing protein, partial [Coriobacteriia bacterium]|nr:PD40 domain-containing protein [Coriobacteriia bacterium]